MDGSELNNQAIVLLLAFTLLHSEHTVAQLSWWGLEERSAAANIEAVTPGPSFKSEDSRILKTIAPALIGWTVPHGRSGESPIPERPTSKPSEGLVKCYTCKNCKAGQQGHQKKYCTKCATTFENGPSPVLKQRVCVKPSKRRHKQPALLLLGPGCHTQVVGRKTVVSCVCTSNLCNTQNSPSNVPGRPESAEAMLKVLNLINRAKPSNNQQQRAVKLPKYLMGVLQRRRVRAGDAMQASGGEPERRQAGSMQDSAEERAPRQAPTPTPAPYCPYGGHCWSTSLWIGTDVVEKDDAQRLQFSWFLIASFVFAVVFVV